MNYLSTRRSLCLAVSLVCALACASDAQDTTGGKRIVLATRLAPSPDVEGEFTTGRGWTLKLSAARLAIGGLYYFDGAPALARNERRTPLERLQSFFIGTAYAHPQHYVAGNALGEMVEPTSVDLLRAAKLPSGDGVTGTFRSGRLVLPKKVVGPAAEELGGHVAAASGVATKGDQTVYFSVAVDLADIEETSPRAEIDGCVFEEADVSADGTVTLTVSPHVWFNLMDFSGVAPGSEEAPTEIVRGEVAHKAFTLGVAQLSAYRFEYSP